MMIATKKQQPKQHLIVNLAWMVGLSCAFLLGTATNYGGGLCSLLLVGSNAPETAVERNLATSVLGEASSSSKCNQQARVVIPPVELRKGNRKKMTDVQYLVSAKKLVNSIRLLVGTGKSNELPTPESTSLDNRVIMDYGCGPGRFLVGLQAANICFAKYIGVDVGVKEINWLTETHSGNTDSSSLEFIHVNVQNDRYNKKGTVLNTEEKNALIFTPKQTAALLGTVDVMVLRSVFSHMRSEDIFHHLKALQPMLKPGSGVMAVSLFVRTDAEETVISQEKVEQGLHIVVISKQVFERMVHDAGYHILLYTTLMGQETYILATGQQSDPISAS